MISSSKNKAINVYESVNKKPINPLQNSFFHPTEKMEVLQILLLIKSATFCPDNKDYNLIRYSKGEVTESSSKISLESSFNFCIYLYIFHPRRDFALMVKFVFTAFWCISWNVISCAGALKHFFPSTEIQVLFLGKGCCWKVILKAENLIELSYVFIVKFQ